jgi:hypothetical protein
MQKRIAKMICAAATSVCFALAITACSGDRPSYRGERAVSITTALGQSPLLAVPDEQMLNERARNTQVIWCSSDDDFNLASVEKTLRYGGSWEELAIMYQKVASDDQWTITTADRSADSGDLLRFNRMEGEKYYEFSVRSEGRDNGTYVAKLVERNSNTAC